MTKSNNEWVPVVGCICEAFNYELDIWLKVKVLDGESGYGEHPVMAFEKDRGGLLFWAIKFREIKTEAEKRRDEAIQQLIDTTKWRETIDLISHISTQQAEMIIDAGWRKPRPLTDLERAALAEYHEWDIDEINPVIDHALKLMGLDL
ncbi:hypothetical protein [uncultured Methylophaga sp.]|uniref:hypothetical protein n=1 Tax=uncultured Methylophaga sp. TaxID=285271 RepID=UPI0030FA601F